MNIRVSTAIMATVLACGIVSAAPVFAAPARPCEDVLKEFRDTKAAAKPDAVTLKAVEDLEAKGPVKLSEVEKEQKEILVVVRRLADEGQVAMGGKGDDAYV